MVKPSLPSNNRGIALIMVLWVLTLLSVMALEFAYAMRTEVDICGNYKDELKGYFLARAGVERASLEIVRYVKAQGKPLGESQLILWNPDGSHHKVAMKDGEFVVAIEDEAGKIDRNGASEDDLRNLFTELGVSAEVTAVLVDSILDWRDKDDVNRLNGAENEYYRALPVPYDCKDGDFDAVEEIVLVRGVTPDIYGKLEDRVTMYAKGRINVNTASPESLKSVVMDDTLAKSLLEERKDKPFSQEALNLALGAHPAVNRLGTTSSYYFTIKSTGRVAGSNMSRSVKAVVYVDNAGGYRVRVEKWMDRWKGFEDVHA